MRGPEERSLAHLVAEPPLHRGLQYEARISRREFYNEELQVVGISPEKSCGVINLDNPFKVIDEAWGETTLRKIRSLSQRMTSQIVAC